MDPFSETSYYLTNSWTTPETARALIGAFGVLLPLTLLGLFVWSWRRHRRLAARAAEAMHAAGAALHPGDTVIGGKVADDGEGAPVKLTIEQQGREWNGKGGWRHQWSEVTRSVAARPFYVIRANGDRVRVEPDERVFLVDVLEAAVSWGAKGWRRRSATLSPGEPVYVTGTLAPGFDPQQGGYRDAAPAMVLRPPARGRMLISTEPLTDRHRARARIHGKLAVAAALALAIINLGILLRPNMLMLFGRTVSATVVERHTWKEWVKPKSSRGYWKNHWSIDAQGPDGRRFIGHEVSGDAYGDLETGKPVPFIVAGPFEQIGTHAACESSRVGFLVTLTLIFLAICGFSIVSTRAWYERGGVTDDGVGRLVEN